MILQSIRWSLAYLLSCQDIKELMQGCGYSVDYSTINCWVIHYSPKLKAAFRRKKKCVDTQRRMGKTYVKEKGNGHIII